MNVAQLLFHIERFKEAYEFGILGMFRSDNAVQLGYEEFLLLVRENNLKITIKDRGGENYPYEAETEVGGYLIYAVLDEARKEELEQHESSRMRRDK